MAICTLFDHSYAVQGISLLRSIRRHHGHAERLVVCALDKPTEAIMYDMMDSRMEVIPVDTLERIAPELEAMRLQRSRAEWCWMLTPFLCRETLNRHPVAEYLDADCWLMAPLDEARVEIGAAPVGIVPHRWSPQHAVRLKDNGAYNVGYMRFDGSAVGREVVEHWCKWCANWQPSAPGERFMDQKCLEDWPERFGAHVVQHVGVNLAPYNQAQYEYTAKYTETDDVPAIYVNGQRLLMYHFHEWRMSDDGIRIGGYKIDPFVLHNVYKPYATEALNAACML